MFGLILGWCVAGATPQTVALPNGVRVVVDSTQALGSQVEVGWFTDAGSAHRTPGAIATALAAHRHGTSTVSAQDARTVWQEAVHTEPTLYVSAHQSGLYATVHAADLEAWAWLASDALADTQLTDLVAVHHTATSAFPPDAMDGFDRAPAPESWPAVLPDHPVSQDVVHRALTDLADPEHLVVVVRGDLDPQTTVDVLSPYFARLPAVDSSRTAPTPTPRAARREQVHTGPAVARIRVDVPASAGSETLARILDAHVGTALSDVAFDARVTLMMDAPIWTLELRATPMPGRADRVPGAWTAWLQTLQGTGVPPSATPGPRDAVHIAHDALYPLDSDDPSATRVLDGIVGANSTVLLTTPQPDDEEIDVIRRTIGELAAELVRIRLRELDTLEPQQIPAWIERLGTERDAVTPRLRPALDLLIRRAEERA